MIYVILIIMSAILILSRLVINDKLSRVIILLYVLWWEIWLGVSTFNFYDLFSVSNSTYYLLLLNVIMFCFGFLFCGVFRNKNRINVQCINYKVSKNSWFLKLLILVVFILLYYWLKYRNVVSLGISSNSAMERFSVGNVFTSGVELLAFSFFINPFMYAAIIILAYMTIYAEFKNITFVLLAFSIFLYAGIGSGRGPVIDILIAMVLIFFVRIIESGRKKQIANLLDNIGRAKKIKLWNFIFFALITLIIFVYSAWLTSSRMGYSTELNMEAIQIGGNEFFNQCVVYFTGPFRALDYGIRNYPNIVGNLYGRGTFAGIDQIIIMAFRIIGIKNIPTANETILTLLQNNQIQIGYNQYFNFAYTSLMIYYFDLGVLGVVIFPFLYGFFVRNAVFLYEKKPILPTLIIMVFLFNTMIYSVFKWGLQTSGSNILLVACYFLYKCRNKRSINE